MLTLLLFIISIFVALFLALSFRQAVAYSTKLRGLSTMPPSNGRKSVTPAVVRLRPLALIKKRSMPRPANSDSPAVGGHASAAVGAPLVAARAAVVEKIKPWKEITNPNHKEGGIPCEEYVDALESSVRNRLPQVLTDVVGLRIEGTLEQQNPVKISGEQRNLRSFKEHWRWENCHQSLETNSFYEAPGNGFWASAKKGKWLGKEMLGAEMTYGHLAAGREQWSDEKFFRSAEDPSKRQYFIAGIMPTAVVGLDDVPREDGKGFIQLPCFGSRSVLAGWYSKMDDALNALESAVGDQKAKAAEHVRKLYETFLSFPMRLRLSPSHSQICLDRISYGEDLYMAKMAASDSFFRFCPKCDRSFSERTTICKSSAKDCPK